MCEKSITHIIVILSVIFIGTHGHYYHPNLLKSKLVNTRSLDRSENYGKHYEVVKLIIPKFKKSRYQNESTTANASTTPPEDGTDPETRFIDYDEDEGVASHSSEEYNKIVPLDTRRIATTTTTTTTESSFLDLLIGNDKDKDEDDDDEEEDEDDDKDEEDEEDEKDNDVDDDDDDEDDKKDKKDKQGSHDLRQVRRRYTRVHKFIFPLLLAYKLKFFTMVPLLVGSLVLLVGTTGVAGFFFALFAAAMGLHVKTSH